MKKYLPFALLLASPTLLAQPYISLGLGTAELDHDEDVIFSDNTKLTPDSNEGAFQLTLGKRFERFGVEVSYRRFEGEDSRGLDGFVTDPAGRPAGYPTGNYEHEQDWDAKLKAQQFAVRGVYFHDLSDRLTLKAGAGVTYTDYELSSSWSEEYELDVLNGPDYEYGSTLESSKTSDDAWGGLVSVGVDYAVLPQLAPNLTLGLEASVAADKYSTTSALYANLGWKF